jgi:hypothetical protein
VSRTKSLSSSAIGVSAAALVSRLLISAMARV